MSSQELPSLVTEEISGSATTTAVAPAPTSGPGLELALSDIRTYIAEIINGPSPHQKNSMEFIMSIKKIHQERTAEWQKLKATMGKEEFMRIGYCDGCAAEAELSFRKEIATKCARHSE